MATTTANELLQLETRYWQALKDRDTDTMMRLSDDPCIVAGAQGVTRLDRASLAAMVEQGGYTLNEFELKEPEVKMLGDDVAIIAYKAHEELTVDGRPIALDAAEASTWVRRNGQWLCAMHTESLEGDPFGRDKRSRTP